MSLYPTIKAPVLLRPPGYPGSPSEENRELPVARESLRSANPAEIIFANFQFYEDQITECFRVITDELRFSDGLVNQRNLLTLQLLTIFIPFLAAQAASSLTNCGVEPLWHDGSSNSTLNLNGTTLRPFVPCLRQFSLAAQELNHSRANVPRHKNSKLCHVRRGRRQEQSPAEKYAR